MSWATVPAKFAEYQENEYGGVENARRLLVRFTPTNVLANVPVSLQEEFERQLDYQLGACRELVKSRAIDPKKLSASGA